MLKLSRRSFLAGASALALTPSPSVAWVHGVAPQAAPTAQTVQNIDPSVTFANFIKLAQSQSAGDPDYPKYLDANGFPNSGYSAASSALTGQLVIPVNTASVGSSVHWVLKWTGTGAFEFGTVAAGVNITSNSNATILGNAFNFIAVNTVAGTPVRIEFTWNSAPPSPISYNFPTGKTYSSMSGLVLCRLSDEAAIDANPNAINPDYTAQIKLLNPKDVRTLQLTGAVSAGCVPGNFAQRWSSSAFSYHLVQWMPSLWTGATSGTDTYTCSAPSGWGGLVNGATVQVFFTNACTITTPTLNVGGSGAITIVNRFVGALTVGNANFGILANTSATLVYNDLLNVWIWNPGGLGASIPIEAQVTISNTLNISFWYNLFPFYSDADCAAIASYVQANLNPGLSCYFEYGNEMWNGAFSIWAFFNACGLAFGFPNTSERPQYGASSLRIRQAMAAITTAWGDNPGLVRVMAFQASSGSSVNGNDTRLFQSADLASIANGGAGNALWISYTGNANYTAVGQRAIDFCDVLSYAPYYNGSQLVDGDGNYSNVGGTGLTTGGPGSAIGSIVFNNQPIAGSTLVFNGTTVTFVASGPTGNQVLIGGSTTATATNLAAFLRGSADSNIILFGSRSSGATVGLVARSAGTSGNSLTLSSTGTTNTTITQMSGGTSTGAGTAINGLTGAADAFAGGDTTNSLAWVDWDIRQGNNNGLFTGNTLIVLDQLENIGFGSLGIYQGWETMAAKYSLPVYCYEGGMQCVAPSTGECTTLGISTTYGGTGGKIDNLLTAYKNSTLFAQVVTDQFNQFLGKYPSSPNFGLLPHSKGPAWFGQAGPSQWSLMPGNIYTGPLIGSSQWQSFNAIEAFNT